MARTGWYNDESDPALARWFDGVAWTDHVLEKAEWEAIGVEPPPPQEWPEDAYYPGPDRRRLALAAVVAVAALAVGGVALARDGGGGGSDRSPTADQQGEADRLGDLTGAGVDGTVVDPGLVSSDPTDAVTDEGSSGAAGGTSRASRSPSTTKAPTVRRTETATQTHSNTGPVTSPGAGTPEDKTSVGNQDSKSIVTGYDPPPPTTTTVAETTTTVAPVEDPPPADS